MPRLNDHRPKATQWAFTLPAFKSKNIICLSTLPAEEILYITFAVVDDDTGNRYLQGFIKTVNRCRVGKLITLMGYTFYSTVGTSGAVTDLLAEIQLNDEVFEFGDSTVCNRQGRRNDIAMFKHSVDSGIFSIALLKDLHSKICENYPGLVHDYIKKNTLIKNT
jgi:hypothetical protein